MPTRRSPRSRAAWAAASTETAGGKNHTSRSSRRVYAVRGRRSGGGVGELVCDPAPGRGGPPPPDDRRRAALPRLDQRLPDGAGPLVERRRLEHAHGAVPEDGLGLQDPGAEVEAGGSIDVEDGIVGRDAIARHLLAFGGGRGTGGPHPAAGGGQPGPPPGGGLFCGILPLAVGEGGA